MNSELITFNTRVADLKRISTRTQISMVVFSADGKACKAFRNVADACEKLNGYDAEISASMGHYQGRPEYAVVSIKGAVDGLEISASDDRVNPESRPTEEAVIRTSRGDLGEVIEGIIRHIRAVPTRSGLKMVTFRVGQYPCKCFGEIAERIKNRSPEYEGKLTVVCGQWETNRRGVKELIVEATYTVPDRKYRSPTPAAATREDLQAALTE